MSGEPCLRTTADLPRGVSSFFIVGAPRCGTTSLSSYLADHPAVCFSRPKETHFFVLDPADRDPSQARAEYLGRYFTELGAEHRAIGEGSPSYLYSHEAIARIQLLFPDARFVACVRNPIELVHSLHLRMLYTLEEDQEDFRDAWSLQGPRARGERVPATCRDPRLLQYAQVGRLGYWLERLLDQVGRERCFVSVFDDLAGDPGKLYRSLLEFLELPYDGRTHFPRKRSTRRYRSRAVQRLVKRPPRKAAAFIARTAARREKVRRHALLRLRDGLRRRNKLKTERVPLDAETRRMLRQTFAEDIARLEGLLGRDLGHWT
jgi:hypothetical protein